MNGRCESDARTPEFASETNDTCITSPHTNTVANPSTWKLGARGRSSASRIARMPDSMPWFPESVVRLSGWGLLGVLGALSTGVVACTKPVEIDSPDLLWRTDADLDRTTGPAVSTYGGRGELRLPQAANAGTLEVTRTGLFLPGGRFLVVARQSDGSVLTNRHWWWGRLERTERVQPEEEEDPDRADGPIGEIAKDLAHEPRRDVAFRIDRLAPWRDVRPLLRAAHLPGSWRLVVDSVRARRADADAVIDVVVGSEVPDPSGAAALRLTSVGAGVVSVRVGDRSDTFKAGNPYDADSVRIANPIWERVRRDLSARAGQRVALVVSDDVPWAYVAQSFAILLDVRVASVTLDDPRVALSLSTPPLTHIDDYGTRDSRDWPTWLAIGIGVAAAVVLFHRQLRDPKAVAAHRGPHAETAGP